MKDEKICPFRLINQDIREPSKPGNIEYFSCLQEKCALWRETGEFTGEKIDIIHPTTGVPGWKWLREMGCGLAGKSG